MTFRRSAFVPPSCLGHFLKAIQLTIIVPVYKGEPFLEQLLREVSTVVSQVAEAGTPLEISECICVDDGSIDKSAEVLVKLAGIYPWLRVLTLSMNFGQHPATVAGILNSSGDWLVTLDEDLQHKPNHILTMLWQACIDGADVVYAKPLNGPHQSFFRDTASRVAKSCVARFTGNPFVKDFSSFRLIRGDVARAAAASCSRETYFDIALTWYTRRFTTLCIDMTDLRYTVTKDTGYRPSQLLQHAVRLMVTSDARILRLGFRAGAFGMIMGLIITIAIVATKIWRPSGIPVQGWTPFIALYRYL